MIEILNRSYVNCWVLGKDLPELAKQSQDEEFRRLCAVVQENYTYPVDSILVSLALDVPAQMDVNEVMSTFGDPAGYLAMLEKGIAAQQRKAEPGR